MHGRIVARFFLALLRKTKPLIATVVCCGVALLLVLPFRRSGACWLWRLWPRPRALGLHLSRSSPRQSHAVSSGLAPSRWGLPVRIASFCHFLSLSLALFLVVLSFAPFAQLYRRVSNHLFYLSLPFALLAAIH